MKQSEIDQVVTDIANLHRDLVGNTTLEGIMIRRLVGRAYGVFDYLLKENAELNRQIHDLTRKDEFV